MTDQNQLLREIINAYLAADSDALFSAVRIADAILDAQPTEHEEAAAPLVPAPAHTCWGRAEKHLINSCTAYYTHEQLIAYAKQYAAWHGSLNTPPASQEQAHQPSTPQHHQGAPMTTHKAIREALEAGPTEGPWRVDDGGVFSSEMNPHRARVILSANAMDDQRLIDATFIAACNPAAIRALLADLDAKTEALKSVQAAIYMDDAGQLRLTRSFDESVIDAALKGTP